MATLLLIVWSLLCFIIGTNGDICQGDYSSYVCIFGCCNDYAFETVYVYCCLSNGAGIAIITACVIIFLSIIGCFCRRHRYRNRGRPPMVMFQQGAPSVSIVSSTADQYSYSNPQMMGTAAPPPPYPGLPETAAPDNKFSY